MIDNENGEIKQRWKVDCKYPRQNDEEIKWEIVHSIQ